MVSTVLVPTVGVTLIGVFISVALYGVVSMQTLSYFQTFGNKDGWGLKSLVTFIWLLETTHLFLICAAMFRWVILDADDLAILSRTQVSDDVVIFITALIILAVQCFYARRLWILSEKNILLVSVVVIIAVADFGLEIVVMTDMIKFPNILFYETSTDDNYSIEFPEINEFHKVVGSYVAALVMATANDIIIAIAMVYLLKRRRTDVKSTNSIVTKVITYSISTGILTSVVQIVVLITNATLSYNLIFLAFYAFVNNLYANSLLAMLNMRESLREMRPTENVSPSFRLSDLHGDNSGNTTEQETRSNLTKVPWARVVVTTETQTTV